MFFNPTRRKAVAPKQALTRLTREPIPHVVMTDDEIRSSVGSTLILDIECFPNFFLVAFKHVDSGKVFWFEQSPDSAIDFQKLRYVLWAFEIVTFNGNRYDMPLLAVALLGCVSCGDLKAVSDDLILENVEPRQIAQQWQVKLEAYNHVDLKAVAPLDHSLKKYAARIHAPRLQELPYSPHEPLTAEQGRDVREYCINDLDNTDLLRSKLRDQLKLREAMSKLYGIDLRSKSDAQIAEAVIVAEVTKLRGKRPKKPTVKSGWSFNYDRPSFVRYETPSFQTMLGDVLRADFTIDEHGSPRCPAMQELIVHAGGNSYAMGIGGLHSRESKRAVYADEQYGLRDIDVASYYPSLILNERITPESMGDDFLDVYKTIVKRRLDAKREGNKVEADSLKITANGTFGKLGSQYSAMYSAEGMIQVTLTGQLSILMLIEWLTLAGFEVMSGNTDGILVLYARYRVGELDSIVGRWREATGLETENVEYRAMFNRDVNNYIAIKDDGEVKLKGVYAEKGSTGNTVLSKNPEGLIISDAIVSFLRDGKPIETTVRECKDFRRFVFVREVKGGGELDGCYLGKVVRYYYGEGARATINYVGSGNKVPDSQGARQCMDLPDKMPTDIDYARYIREAQRALIDIGHTIEQQALF